MLRIESYDDGERFWREVAERMTGKPVLNNVFVGVANRIRSEGSTDLMRLGVFEGPQLMLGALRTPPFRLNLAHLGEGEQAATALAEALAERRVKIPGVVGPEHLAQRFAARWEQITLQKPVESHGRRQNLYEIKRVTQPKAEGRMRPAVTAERALLIEWEVGFAEDAGLSAAEREPGYIARMVDDGLGDHSFVVWEVDGEPVSSARLRPIVNAGARVSGVFTPRSLRGRGYASALTAALSQQVIDEGKWCCLFADADNPLTNRIYQRIGYRKVAEFADIHFEENA